MDRGKDDVKVQLTFDLMGLAHVYKNYLRGFRWAISTPEEIKKGKDFVNRFENILLKTGYMTEREIEDMHPLEMVQPVEGIIRVH